jgi:hypothetical protein
MRWKRKMAEAETEFEIIRENTLDKEGFRYYAGICIR